MRIRMLIAAALTTAVVVVGVAAPAAEAGQRKQMVGAINFVRSWENRAALRFSPGLSQGASSWARYLMASNILAHSTRAVSRGEGEVIEWHTGFGANINSVVMEWLNSPGHREIMLARDYHRAGAGKAVGWWNGQRSVIWVARFAA